jgi:acetylglutamate kinase
VESSDINTRLIDAFIRGNMVPVFCAITHDCNGSLLNTNADTMAREIAASMSSMYDVELIYCFDKQGVLSNPNDNESVIPLITKESFAKMKESGQVSGGMIPKLDNAFRALENGVKRVVIKHADNLLNGKKTDIILKNFDE